MVESDPARYPALPRLVAAGVGALALLAFFLLFAWPPGLVESGYRWTALALALAAVPLVAFFALLASRPDVLQRILSRISHADLRDGGQVAAVTVMVLTLFFVVGYSSIAGGIASIEDVYGPKPDAVPVPAGGAEGAPRVSNLTANLTPDGVNLTWRLADGPSADRYHVYRGGAPGHEVRIATVNVTNLTDTNASAGQEHLYRVTAENAAGEGAPSEAAAVLIPADGNAIRSGILVNVALLVLPVVFYVSFVHGLGPGATLARLGLTSHGIAKGTAIGVAAAVGFLVLAGLVVAGLQQVQDLPDNDRARAIGLGLTLGGALALATGAAFSEEIFFRGFLQPRIGLWGQAIVFALAHLSYVDVTEVVVVFVLALVFGFLRKWTGTLWAAIAGHFAFNLIQLVAVICTADPGQCGL